MLAASLQESAAASSSQHKESCPGFKTFCYACLPVGPQKTTETSSDNQQQK
jgi:hypothetical protein